MMTLDQFIRTYQVMPADAIVLNKKNFRMLDHYVIYLGTEGGQHKFVANYTEGVKVIPNSELQQFLLVLQPTSIDRFPGPENQRRNAVTRALARIGEKAYALLSNNCEHFKNWVHYGIEKSGQVENLGKTLIVTGLSLAAVGSSNKNNTITRVGVFATVFGALAYLADKATQEKRKA